MPRILVTDTEAFAPQEPKVKREPHSDRTLENLNKIRLGLDIAHGAAPIVGGIAGLADKYIVTPIAEHMQAGREEEYKKSRAGEQMLEDEEMPAAPTMQQIAAQRLQEKGMPAKQWLEEARAEAAVPPGIAMPKGPKAKYRPSPEMVKAKAVGRGEQPWQERVRLAQELAAEKAREVPIGAQGVVAPDLGDELLQQRIAALKLRQAYKDATPEQKKQMEIAAISRRMAAHPEEETPGVSVRPGGPAAAAAPAAAPAAPAAPAVETRRTQHPLATNRVTIDRPAPMPAAAPAAAAPAAAAPEAGVTGVTTAERHRGPMETAAPAAPTGPKTLATATEDELQRAKDRLQKRIDDQEALKKYGEAYPESTTLQTLKDRMKMIELEQRHRGEKMSYNEWAARARAADTPEEQAEVMRLAANVRMPVGGLEDIIKTPFQRAKEAALGTRENKGLFPDLARPLTEEEAELRRLKIDLMRKGMPAKEAEAQAKIDLEGAKAQYYQERTKTEAATRVPTVTKIWEQAQLLHQLEGKAVASADFYHSMAGRAKTDEWWRAFNAMQAQDRDNMNKVDAAYKDAESSYGRLRDQASNDLRDAQTAQTELAALQRQIKANPQLEDKDRAKLSLDLAALQTKQRNAEAKAESSRQQADAASASFEAVRSARDAAVQAAKQNEPLQNELEKTWFKQKGMKVPPAANPEPTATPTKMPTEKSNKPALKLIHQLEKSK